MARKYRAGYKHKRRGRKFLKLMLVVVLIGLVLGGFIYWDMRRNSDSGEVVGAGRSVPQQEDLKAEIEQVVVDEPLFSMKIAAGWKEIERKNVPTERSITWQSTVKNYENRWLKLYIDVIPPDIAVNRLLPLDVAGDSVSHRQLSENCKNFTRQANDQAPTPQPSKWEGVDFICNLASFNDNVTGTGTEGSVNSTTITGPRQGAHKYFFVYTDRNIQPDYTIFYNALKSFKAK